MALKQQVSGDLWLGGADLAATFIALGLVDEYRMYVVPIVLGGGTRFLPATDRPLPLRLVDEPRTFPGGVVRLRYEPS